MRARLASQPTQCARSLNQFEAWAAERSAIERRLNSGACGSVRASTRLLRRSLELERLILETPGVDLPAAKAKAAILLWHMEMERADGLVAMRHLRDFLEALS